MRLEDGAGRGGNTAFLRRGDLLVAPPTRLKVALTLIPAVLLQGMPWPLEIHGLLPDLTLMALLYWNIHAPRLAGLGTAFALGLLMDVAHGFHLGFTALAYCSATFVVLMLRRRLEHFDAPRQNLQIVPVLIGESLLLLGLGVLFGYIHVEWSWLAGGVVSAVLWTPMARLLDLLTDRAPVARAAGD